MKLEIEPIILETKHPFKIARGERKIYKNFIFRLAWEGITGIGEAAPQEYYGEDEQSILSAVSRIEDRVNLDPEALREDIFSGSLRSILDGDASVRAALDMALWDIKGKRQDKPCYELFSIEAMNAPLTSYTIGFGDPEAIKEKVREAEPYKILKMKAGLPGDMELIDLVMKMTDKKIRIDANEGWDLETALSAIGELTKRGIEFVEQPLSHHSKEELKVLKSSSGVPIILDESIINPEDVDECMEMGHGINIKLMKCGGITPALEMIKRARKAQLKVMLGCMIETSISITAAAHLSPMVDFADLDGNLLLSEDPFEGVKVIEGKLVLPSEAGLGVRRREGRER